MAVMLKRWQRSIEIACSFLSAKKTRQVEQGIRLKVLHMAENSEPFDSFLISS